MAFTAEQQSIIDSVNASDEVFRSVVANVQPDQWGAPTVNDGWTVRDLVNHIVAGSKWTTNLGAGSGTGWPEGDFIGSDDPLHAHEAAHAEMLATFENPQAWNQSMPGPMGEMPASQVLGFRTGELLHHAWDVAKATGQSTDIAPEASQGMLDGMRVAFEHYDRSDGMFKPETPVADDAPAADRLAAFLGKRVD